MARDLNSADPLKQQKARALRIDHQYFTRPHPWRSLMTKLSWILPLVGLALVGAYALIPTGNSLYMPGPVATRHASFANRCNECHEGDSTHWGAVLDSKCNRCHEGPLHSPRQVYHTNSQKYHFEGAEIEVAGATCASCHTEHKGSQRLADIASRHCTQCHADLKVRDGSPGVDANIHSFNNGHKDWDALKLPDNTQLKFNHAAHMKPSIKNAAGNPIGCTDCHAPDQQRLYMQPINYEAHCAACHPISIPPILNIGNVPLPHDKPGIVSSVVKTSFSDYLITNGGKVPAKLSPNPEYVPPKPGRKPKPGVPEFLEQPDARTPQKWLDESIATTLQPLFFPDAKQMTSSCIYCHVSAGKEVGTELAKIIDPKIPSIWLTRSKFSHESHRVMGCNECHAQAATSTKTEDVLLPGIQSCQQCHSDAGGARSGCNECHLFHMKQVMNFNGKLTVEELLSGKRNKPAEIPPIAKPEETPAETPVESAEPKPEPKKE